MIDIEKIYRRAFDLVKKNRVLWIFGLALLVFAGGGNPSNFNFNNFSSFSDGFKGGSPDVSNAKVPNINYQPVVDYFKNLFGTIPVSLYILLGVAFLITIIIGIVISIVVSSWAKGAAIGAINDAYDGKAVTLKNGADYGLKNLKNIIWLNLVPTLLYALAVILLTVIFAVLIILLYKTPIVYLFYLLAGIALVAVIIGSLAISSIQIWAHRIVVIEGKSGKEGFFEGWIMVKKYFMQMVVLGVVNCFTNCIFGCCLGLIIGILAVVLIFSGIGIFAVNITMGIVFATFAVIVGIVLIFLAGLAGGIYQIFNYSTWNILYRELKSQNSKI